MKVTGGLTRRETLIGAVGAVAAGSTAVAAHAPGSLDGIAAGKGMRFGSAISWSPANADRGSFANPAYARLIEAECGLIVPETEMKWQQLRPSPTRFAFDRFDAIVTYAERQGLAVRGHNLLWHQPKWLPRWLNAYDFGARPQTEAARVLSTHIRTVLDRYGTRIGGYDVVNEAFAPRTAHSTRPRCRRHSGAPRRRSTSPFTSPARQHRMRSSSITIT